MKKKGYYSSGEFARMAHVTLRTIRYYDKQDLLKPSFVTESGARLHRQRFCQTLTDSVAKISGLFTGRYPRNDH